MTIVDDFLTNISTFCYAKDSQALRDWLKVEPPLPKQYYELASELKILWHDNRALEAHVGKLLPERNNPKPEDGDVWPGFLSFVKDYLLFWRDIEFDDLPGAHRELSALVKYVIHTHVCASQSVPSLNIV